MGYVEGISRDQIMMVDLESLIPEESECRVIDAFCEKLDTKKMGFKHSEVKDEGRPAYPPKVLIKLFLYGYLTQTSHTQTTSKASLYLNKCHLK